ncbi:MAG: hypothetical protein QOG53_605 [Frankiales bacterium]|jgi:hypothetical protein|nr:hypothetical protein [Frankiales bacterium]
MPHACRAMNTDSTLLSRILAGLRRTRTHVCETAQDSTTYCGLTVAQVDDNAVATSRPTRFGPVHSECEVELRRRHPTLD